MNDIPHIFIAYARKDKAALQKLKSHLNILQRRKLCRIFFDGEINPGEQWDKRLKDELYQADIFVLLIREDFLDSDYINEVELPKILEKERNNECQVIPVILRECLWTWTELGALQAVLDNDRPIEETKGYGKAAHAIASIVSEQNETIKRQLAAIELKKSKAADLKRIAEQEKQDRLQKEKEQKAAEAKRKKEEAAHRREIDPFYDIMIPIKGGTFQMGDEHGDLGERCLPVHSVKVKDFQLSKYPVTQAQWRAVMGADPPKLHFFGYDDFPVESVSWGDAQEFLKKLNDKIGGHYRLPSEAEWEYAARGGSKSKHYKYAGSNNVGEVAWSIENAAAITKSVGRKKANELGLHEMSGYVWEWCEDVWHKDYYGAPNDGSVWAVGGDLIDRVVRGGSWFTHIDFCRVSFRHRYDTGDRQFNVGFRLARY